MIPALMIPYAQGLVWATALKEWQTSLSFLLLLTIINIHILTSLKYNSADLQACYLANIIYIVQLDS